MELRDTLTLDGLRITNDGYLVADVKAARTGIQMYSGREVDPENVHGMRDKAQVRVYRPESEVFHKDALASFTSIPVTDDHPSERVTADNWRLYARGNTGETVARDGEAMRVPLILKDAAIIKKVQDGKRELSCGYDCEIDFKSGVTNDGLEYDAIQNTIRGNHLAIVGVARGGPELRIGDAAMPKSLVIDGNTVELSDAGFILVDALLKREAKLTADLAAANTTIGTHVATIATRDGEVAALKSQVADAAMTPAKLDAAVKDRSALIDSAKKIFPAIVVDGKSDAEIRKMAVAHKLTDAAVAAMNDDGIKGAFSTLATVTVAADGAGSLSHAIADAQPQSLADGAKKVADARAEMLAELGNGGKPVSKAA